MNKTILYDSFETSRKLPLNVNEIAGKEHFIITNEGYGPTYICELKDVYVSPYGAVFKNMRLVKESVATIFEKVNYYPSFWKKLLLGRVKRVPGTSMIGLHSWFDNFYHFTNECLPRLFLLKDYAQDANLVVLQDMPGFVQEYIRLLGFKNLIPLNGNEMVLAEKLIFPTHSAGQHFQNPAVMQDMVNYIKTRIDPAVVKRFSTYRNVYISRQKAKYRRVVNEPELEVLLKNYEFKTINLEDLNVEEQIALMLNIRNLVAVHGAGLSNIMFMPKGGLLIELIHKTHFQPCYYNLANVFEHDTVYLQGAASEQGLDPTRDDVKVDLTKLKFYLDNNMRS